MKLFAVFALLALIGLVMGQHYECPTEDEAMALDLREQHFYKTEDFLANEAADLGESMVAEMNISVDYVMAQQKRGAYAATQELQQVIEAESADVFNEGADASGASVDGFGHSGVYSVPYYYPTCPYWWHRIPRFAYYFRSVSYPPGQVIYNYHWSYYPIWQTVCVTCYCRMRYGVWNWWDYRYRCFPEYRYVNVWMLRLTVTYKKDASGKLYYVSRYWSRYLTRMWLKRGCCCRRFWRYPTLKAAQCLAP